MNDPMTVRGTVATTPRHVEGEAGLRRTSFRLVTGFRLASSEVTSPAPSNWFTVTACGDLAESAAACIDRGDPLVVTGSLHVRDWEGEQPGVTVELEADAIGHDLTWGTSVFTRRTRRRTLGDPRRSRGVPAAAEP